MYRAAALVYTNVSHVFLKVEGLIVHIHACTFFVSVLFHYCLVETQNISIYRTVSAALLHGQKFTTKYYYCSLHKVVLHFPHPS